MKKEKITHYDETNFRESPFFKRYKRKLRREKFRRFITLPTFLWVLVFLILSSLVLVASYFINGINSWLSGVLVSVACGTITGVIFYFLSNLRSAKLYAIERDRDEIYDMYKLLEDVFFQKGFCDDELLAGTKLNLDYECSEIMEKLERLQEAFKPWNVELFEKKEGLENFAEKVDELCNRFESLSNDADRQEWLSDIESYLNPIRRIMSVILALYGDQLRFMKNYIV